MRKIYKVKIGRASSCFTRRAFEHIFSGYIFVCVGSFFLNRLIKKAKHVSRASMVIVFGVSTISISSMYHHKQCYLVLLFTQSAATGTYENQIKIRLKFTTLFFGWLRRDNGNDSYLFFGDLLLLLLGFRFDGNANTHKY